MLQGLLHLQKSARCERGGKCVGGDDLDMLRMTTSGPPQVYVAWVLTWLSSPLERQNSSP